MKTLITNYNFLASTKQVVFNGYSSINLGQVLMITNTTSNTIIYLFSNPTLGGAVSGNTLTLTYNTGSMSNTDKLLIYYDDPTSTLSSAISDIGIFLRQILQGITRPIWYNSTLGSLQVVNANQNNFQANIFNPGGTFLGTNVSQVAAFDAKQTLLYDCTRTTWALTVRNRIT